MFKQLGLAALAALLLGPAAFAQDVAVSQVGSNGDFRYFGQAGGKHAYSFATTSCNVGDEVIWWYDTAGGGSPGPNQHPVIGQNFFRIANGRIEQLGQSFLKHGFCAVNETTCGACQTTDCDTLGLGCADTYGSNLNDGANGAAKSDIEPTTGFNPYPAVRGPGVDDATIRGRLQVDASEWALPGDIYIAESQYVSEHDQMAGNTRNNASWREIEVDPGNFDVDPVNPTVIGDPAIFAWQSYDSEVSVFKVVNQNEGGTGVHGLYFLGFKAVPLGGAQWRYEYALQNLSSGRSAASFEVPICDPTFNITDTYFRDVDYHSDEIYDNTDWSTTVTPTAVRWETTTPHGVDPNGNALRWGTLYNFGFTADASPGTVSASIGLFVPGTPSSLNSNVHGPCQCGSITNYCGPAVLNSTGLSAVMEVTGSVDIDDNALTLTATRLPVNRIGYFLLGSGDNVFIPPLAEGRYCLGGAPLVRLLPPVLNSGDTGQGYGEYTHTPDLTQLPLSPGQTFNFQSWFRDENPGSTSNFTDAASVTFCP